MLGSPFVRIKIGADMFITWKEQADNIKPDKVDTDKLDEYIDHIVDWLVDKTLEFIIAIIFLLIGFKVCRFIVKLIKKSFDRSGLETSVAGFLLSLIKGILYAIVFIMAASMVGFQVTSLVTILGTASLAIGLALQGSLANFAGGVLILLMKPFKVGDYIIENGDKCEGTVESIDIFYTKLRTVDNRIIVIPNGNITANSVINVSSETVRKLEIQIGVSYDADLKKVKGVLHDIVSNSSYCQKDSEINVFVNAFLESSIQMGIRCFVKTEDYWSAKWQISEEIKYQFDENGIVIPYNKLDVNINQGEVK